MLEFALARRLGRFALDLALEVAPGETLVVAGESGAGKTTLLRLLAGLERPDSGHIVVGGQRWFDAEHRVNVPAWQRSLGFVPQDYALFPHLAVADNVAFGLRAQGIDRAVASRRVAGALEQLGVLEFSRSRPGDLSGGQQQRVALARALVLEPDLLLLDEPLSALDLRTRQVVRGELRRILASLPCVTVYVTHTPTEALALGDRIAVLEEGRLAQVGSRVDLLRFPRSVYLAAFLGTNLVRGRALERHADGSVRVATAWGDLLGHGGEDAGADLFVRVDPVAISLHRDRPVDATNAVPGTITEILPQPPAGRSVRVLIAARPALVAEIRAETASAMGWREHDTVWARFDAPDVECYR